MIDNDLCCGLTDMGQKRVVNQDQFLIAQLNKSMLIGTTSLLIDTAERLFGKSQGNLMLVADGMGGHVAGEFASQMAINSMVERLLNEVHWFFKINIDAEHEFIESLKSMLKATHQEIQKAGRNDAALFGMGTTLTMAYLVWPKMYVLHAGDSRCYLVRKGVVDRLTTDHTLARKMVDAGGMKPEDEEGSRWSNVLWNVLGGKSDAELTAEVRSVTLEVGDAIVMCSDGLHRHLSEQRMVEVLNEFVSAREACEEFVRIANEAGGEDNITAIVSRPQPSTGTTSTMNIKSGEEKTYDTTLNYETYNPND